MSLQTGRRLVDYSQEGPLSADIRDWDGLLRHLLLRMEYALPGGRFIYQTSDHGRTLGIGVEWPDDAIPPEGVGGGDARRSMAIVVRAHDAIPAWPAYRLRLVAFRIDYRWNRICENLCDPAQQGRGEQPLSGAEVDLSEGIWNRAP